MNWFEKKWVETNKGSHFLKKDDLQNELKQLKGVTFSKKMNRFETNKGSQT